MNHPQIDILYRQWDCLRYNLINTIRDRRDLDLALYDLDKDYGKRLQNLRNSLYAERVD